jgi:hypothetical protein
MSKAREILELIDWEKNIKDSKRMKRGVKVKVLRGRYKG